MRRTAPGINYELAAAVRAVNALYGQVPEALQPDVTGERWDQLERELDARCGAGDQDGALAAIAIWQAHAERVLTALAAVEPPDREARPGNGGANGLGGGNGHVPLDPVIEQERAAQLLGVAPYDDGDET